MAGTWGCACGSTNEMAAPVCTACGRAAPAPIATGVAGPAAQATAAAAAARPRPTLLPASAPSPSADAPGAPARRGPVLPVGRRGGGGASATGPRPIPTLSPPAAPPGEPAVAGAAAPALSPVATIPAPPPAPPFVPPPLPPEWSEALEQVRSPLPDGPAIPARPAGPPPARYGVAGPMGGFASGGLAEAPPLDRRSSAALEPPPVERDRRNTVALSLAGLFDDLGAPEITTAPSASAPQKRTTPSFFDMQDESDGAQTVAPRRGGVRTLLSPGGVIAAIAIVAALYIVGYVVSREDPPKPPTDQVTTVAHTR